MEGACTPAVLDKLRRSLMAITEESFQYDKQFIQDYMNWGVVRFLSPTVHCFLREVATQSTVRVFQVPGSRISTSAVLRFAGCDV